MPATILRLPATHGPEVQQHRPAQYVRAMHDDGPAIVLGSTHARWRWSRGYVENVAAAIARAAVDERASGWIYNVGAEPVASEAEWIRALARITGWAGKVLVLPDDDLPLALQQPFDFAQHLELDTARIRRELGYDETVDEAEGLRGTIDWELTTLHEVPDLRLDYAAQDEALQLGVE